MTDPTILTIDDVIRMEPQLHTWAELAAHAYGLYSGVNEAIKRSTEKWPAAAHHGAEYRQELALMAIIRIFATMDRSAEISFQAVHRYLKLAHASEEIAASYAASDPPSPLEAAKRTVRDSIGRFSDLYQAIDFKAFRRMQPFRNGQIAHISWPEVEAAKVTYADLERLVRTCCRMAGELKLMLTGCNDWPEEHLDDCHKRAYDFWSAAISADAENKTMRRLDRSVVR